MEKFFKNQRVIWFGVSTILFFSFIFFSYLVDKNVFRQFDFDITVRLQDNISRQLDNTFSFLSDIGSFEIVTIILLVFLVLCRRLMVIFVLFFYGVFHFIEVYGKTFVEQLPPPEFMLRTEKIIEFPQFHIRQEYSYPSGHAGRAAFLSILFILYIIGIKNLKPVHKWILLGLIGLYDLTMFISRVYLGEHWATDVIGGIILGGSLGMMASLFFQKVRLGSRRVEIDD